MRFLLFVLIIVVFSATPTAQARIEEQLHNDKFLSLKDENSYELRKKTENPEEKNQEQVSEQQISTNQQSETKSAPENNKQQDNPVVSNGETTKNHPPKVEYPTTNAQPNNTNTTQPQVKNKNNEEKNQPADKELFSRKELREQNRHTEIALERAKETSPFKKKAIANTEAREKKQQEILERKQKKASRFQKQAQLKADQKKEELLKKENSPPKSRFGEKARENALKRVLKQEEKANKLHRNKD